jgi:hypothetical protein
MTLLWPKLYPSTSEHLLGVITIITDYWTKPLNKIPYGNILKPGVTNYSYWNCIKNNLKDAAKWAGDFAIRLTCSGVTECGVERVFSHIRWLLGIKRYRLSKETIQHLLYLKDAHFN